VRIASWPLSGGATPGAASPRKAWYARFLDRRVQIALDAAVLALALLASYLLRFEFAPPPKQVHAALVQLPVVLLVQGVLLVTVGAYAFVWRYVGMIEAMVFARAFASSCAVLLALRLGLPDWLAVLRPPISVILMDGVLAFGGVLGMRVVWRAMVERSACRHRDRGNGRGPAVLLIGAGRAGVMAARELQARGDLSVRGFVDDDPFKRGAVICGVKVLGATADLPRLVRGLGIDHVIITIGEIHRKELRRLVEVCQSVPVRVRTIPGLYEILQGDVIGRFRDVRPEDLLEREVVAVDEGDLRGFLGSKAVMVTGAGGSIGSELSRQIARYGPSRLLLVERAEGALFNIDRELRSAWPDVPIVPLLADVGDRTRMRALFATHRPEIVAHAAAHKHVPMMESHPCEALKNNVLGTRVVAELAGSAGVECFILVSSDKAVRPTSVMGASKRITELLVQHLDRCHATRYVAVRFGNVMDSAGSVIPLFREQIAAGGPVTVTHPDMTRYFMTIPEASALVLEAAAMGQGGEIFVLDMGRPVKVLDLAKRLIELSGYKPFEEISIVLTGVRPGEKLFEELSLRGEEIAKTRHPKIFIGNIAGLGSEDLQAVLTRLTSLAETGSAGEIRDFLNASLPEARLEGPAAAPVGWETARRTRLSPPPLAP